jgi:hypothetical protein
MVSHSAIGIFPFPPNDPRLFVLPLANNFCLRFLRYLLFKPFSIFLVSLWFSRSLCLQSVFVSFV